jgi:hypothetical protein
MRIWIFLLLCAPLQAVVIEADDCNVGQSMHAFGDIKLWILNYGGRTSKARI